MPDELAAALGAMTGDEFQALYGRWDPLEPAAVAALLAGSSVRWWIAGGRAARAGAQPREHHDTDVAVRRDDVEALRAHLAGWHLWEAHSGALRPLLPGMALAEDREQLWARRDADHRWQLDLLLDSSTDEWVYKRDTRVRLPWQRALHTVNGIRYLRPEIALLHKAHLDRRQDREDLAAARLEPQAREWLAATLDQLGYRSWADSVRA